MRAATPTDEGAAIAVNVSELALADGSRLFLQCTHKGDGGLTALTTGDVSIRVPTEQNADLVGLSQFTYQEPVPFGSARFL